MWGGGGGHGMVLGRVRGMSGWSNYVGAIFEQNLWERNWLGKQNSKFLRHIFKFDFRSITISIERLTFLQSKIISRSISSKIKPFS